MSYKQVSLGPLNHSDQQMAVDPVIMEMLTVVVNVADPGLFESTPTLVRHRPLGKELFDDCKSGQTLAAECLCV